MAAYKGNYEIVKTLLESGCSLENTDESNKTALFYAVESQNGDNANVVGIIVEFDQNLDHCNTRSVEMV